MSHPFLSENPYISWSSLKPQEIETDITQALAQANNSIDAIIATPVKNYDNCIAALDRAVEPLLRAWNKVGCLKSVLDSPEIRAAYGEMLPKVSEFYSGIFLNEDLWEAVREVEHAGEDLTALQQRHLDETLIDFKHNGAELPKDQKEELALIARQLAKITQNFSEHVLDGRQAFKLIVTEEEQLAGLPSSSKEAARAQAKKREGVDEQAWLFTLDQTSYGPVMNYLDDATVREKMWRASSVIGREEERNNLPIIAEILNLRGRRSQLLGFDHFPDLTLSRRMAKTGLNALHFVEDLHSKSKGFFKKEVQELEQFRAKELGLEKAVPLEPWSFAYWSEKQRSSAYDFDQELLRPYFSVDAVMSGLFDLVQDLFQIKMVKLKTQVCESPQDLEEGSVEVWHEEVRAFEIFNEHERKLGVFYVDIFPRSGKRGGAWMNPIQSGGIKPDGSKELHVGLICGNMTPPIEGKPALLIHREVETLFHEFGHLLHHMLGEVDIPALNGTRVAWDFVELPSQIMENWCWEKEALDRFARHYETGEAIPDELFNKMISARNFQSGLSMMRQLSFGKMDLELHLEQRDWNSEDLDGFINEALDGYQVSYTEAVPSMICRFGHLFSSPVGYAAGYYSYKWAELLDADAFSRFKKEGIFNPEVGLSFRDTVLSKGNSEPPDELFKAFMGRDPNSEALLKRSGLI